VPTREGPAPLDATTVLLWTARRTGVLEALLTEAGTVEAVVDATDVDRRAARLLVEALARESFLERVGEAYEPTNRALGFLAKTDLRSIGRRPRAVDLLDAYAALPATVASGEPPEPADRERHTRNRLGAAAAADEATVRALATAAVRPAPTAERALVVGGAPGTLAREIGTRGPAVTVHDTPDAVDASEGLLARTDVGLQRGSLVGPFDGTSDLLVAADCTGSVSPADLSTFAANAVDALAPGGHLVVLDRLRDGPAGTAATLEALATSADGRPHTGEAYRERLREAGFAAVTVEDVPGTDRAAVVGARHS